MIVKKRSFARTSTAMIAMLAAGLLLFAAPGRADIVLSVESVTAAPGATGTFDVLLSNTGASSVNIGAFSFELSTANTDITFGDVTNSTTTAPYIFPDGLGILTSTGGQTVSANDIDGLPSTDVAPGSTYGLGNVSFTVAPTAVDGETATVSFEPYPNTNLTDASNNVDFTATSGTITVTPEPQTGWLGLALVAIVGWHRKRAATGRRSQV